jgi:DNA-binding response OmpR family regulator
LVRDQEIDVVILDLRMPGQSGWQTLQGLRAEPDIANTPVIVCSAAGAELARVQRDLNDDRTYVIGKPFEIDELLTRIAEAIVSTER